MMTIILVSWFQLIKRLTIFNGEFIIYINSPLKIISLLIHWNQLTKILVIDSILKDEAAFLNVQKIKMD